MGRLLMAPNFQLKTVVDLNKITEIQEKVQPQKQKKQSTIKGPRKPAKDESVLTVKKEIIAKVGQISIELNLQQGDTEEELMRNYKMKLDQQEEYRKKQ